MEKLDTGILLVSEKAEDCHHLQKQLKTSQYFSYSITHLRSAEEANVHLQTEAYDLAIFIHGAGILALTEVVFTRGLDLPILILKGQPEDALKYIQAGACDHLTDWPDNEKLDHRIAIIIERYRHLALLRENQVYFRNIAEFASSVIHNIANVLNSLNVSCGQLSRLLKKSRFPQLQKVTEMLEANQGNLAQFIANDKKGSLIPKYLTNLNETLKKEREQISTEMTEMLKQTRLMGDIIHTQQNIAKNQTGVEKLSLHHIANEALVMHFNLLRRVGISVEQNFETDHPILAQRAKITHVIINLVKNAIESMGQCPERRHKLIFGSTEDKEGNLIFTLSDSGTGFEEDVLERLFSYGFTTKLDGHGFGLHYCAKIMAEYGGTIKAENNPNQHGAVFTLKFPHTIVKY